MPARLHWRLDGYDLKLHDGSKVTVHVVPTQGQAAVKKIVSYYPTVQGVGEAHVSTNELPTRDLTFTVTKKPGVGNPDYRSLVDTITTYLNRDVVYLHAPTDASTRAYLDQRLMWVMPVRWDLRDVPGRSSLPLSASVKILGLPEAYGGTVSRPHYDGFEKVSGGFQLLGTGAVTGGFYYELPEQRSGWPKARSPVTGLLETVTATVGSPRVENQPANDGSGSRNWITYDLAGYLHTADPVSVGDQGAFELYSQPTQGWFEWS